MKIAVDQCLGAVQELELEPGDGKLKGHVAAEFGGDCIELGCRPAVARVHHVRLGKDEIFGDLAQLGVGAERRHHPLFPVGGQRHVRSKEEGAGEIVADLFCKRRIASTLDHSPPHDDVWAQPLHDDGIESGLVVIGLRQQAPDMFCLLAHIFMFEEGALQGHRPALADKTDIGQGLLDADPAGRPFDQENEIEVAVADLADLPGIGSAAEPGSDAIDAGEKFGQQLVVEGVITGRSLKRHGQHRLVGRGIDNRLPGGLRASGSPGSLAPDFRSSE